MHARLRRQTSPLHAQLDDIPFLAKVLSPELSQSHYLYVLRGFQAFMAPVEEALFAREDLAARVPDFQRRRRVSLLERDIAFVQELERVDQCLSQDAFNAALTELPQAQLPSLADAFGFLYVLEGSALGGAVLAAHAERSLGFAPGHGASYFGARGLWGQVAWTGFLGALSVFEAEAMQEGEASLERRQAQTAQAACCLFRDLITFFQRLNRVTGGEVGRIDLTRAARHASPA